MADFEQPQEGNQVQGIFDSVSGLSDAMERRKKIAKQMVDQKEDKPKEGPSLMGTQMGGESYNRSTYG